MSIVKMNSFTLLTFESYKEALLKELQRFENVQFKDLQKAEVEHEFLKKDSFAENVSRLEGELAKIQFAMEKTAAFYDKPKGLNALTMPKETMSYSEFDQYADSYDYESVYSAVKEADEKLKALKAEKDRKKADNQSLQNWYKLDVSVQEIEGLKSIRSFFGTINKSLADSFRETIESRFPCAYIEIFGAVKDEVTAMVLVPRQDADEASQVLKNVGFSRIPLQYAKKPADLIDENTKRITEIEKTEGQLREEFKKYGAEYPKLQIAKDYFQTALARASACENFMKLEHVVLIEGWVPTEDSSALKGILDRVCGAEYYLEEEAVASDSEDVPIKLKNNKMVTAFEDITSMYSMPRYNEIDPTPVLTPFYLVFFGIMVGDAGYGLVLLAGTWLALKKFNLSKGMRNFMQFFFYLSISVICAGLVFGSMFGVTFFKPIKTVTDGVVAYKPILDSQMDIVLMIILSIAVGVVHVVCGLVVKGYMLLRDGRPWAALFDSLFWIITLFSSIGLVLIMAGMLPDSFMPVAKWGLIGSIVGLAATQGRESPSFGGKIGNGLYAVYGLSGYVGDLVSYTRLVALSLSGAYIAYSFNLMVGLIPGTVFKIVAGGLIAVFGQSLNFGLALLGAYVHTCRLQYVEFFGKFYEGGGRPFRPLTLKNNYIDIK